jgi:hypothetical protein
MNYCRNTLSNSSSQVIQLVKHVLRATHPSVYLPTCPFTFLFTKPLGRYLPNPTYKASSTYLVTIPIDPTIVKNNEEKKWRYCMELGFVHSSKIKGMIKLLVTIYIRVLQICIDLKHYVFIDF